MYTIPIFGVNLLSSPHFISPPPPSGCFWHLPLVYFYYLCVVKHKNLQLHLHSPHFWGKSFVLPPFYEHPPSGCFWHLPLGTKTSRDFLLRNSKFQLISFLGIEISMDFICGKSKLHLISGLGIKIRMYFRFKK